MFGDLGPFKKGLQEKFDKINFIIDFWVDPCDAPVTVWVDCLWPASLELLANYYAIDMLQIARSRFKSAFKHPRMKSGRKGRRGRKSGRFKWFRKLGQLINFDPWDELGKQQFAWTHQEKTLLKSGTSSLFIFQGIIERFAWWLWILDLLSDFLYNWAGLMEETYYCQHKDDDTLQAQGPDQPITGVFGWVGLTMPTIIKIRGHISWDVSSGSCTGPITSGVVSADLETGSSFPGTGCGLRVTVTQGDGTVKVYKAETDLGYDSTGSLTVGFVAPGPATFTVEHRVQFGIVTFKKPMINAYCAYPKELKKDEE